MTRDRASDVGGKRSNSPAPSFMRTRAVRCLAVMVEVAANRRQNPHGAGASQYFQGIE